MSVFSNVTAHGELTRERYRPVMQRADVAIGPLALHRKNLHEASALKVAEYLAHGIPVILGCPEAAFPDGAPFLLQLSNSEDNVERSIDAIGASVVEGHRTFNVVNPHDDGVSLDTFVDWLVADGHAIERVADHAEWVARFRSALGPRPWWELDLGRRRPIVSVDVDVPPSLAGPATTLRLLGSPDMHDWTVLHDGDGRPAGHVLGDVPPLRFAPDLNWNARGLRIQLGEEGVLALDRVVIAIADDEESERRW